MSKEIEVEPRLQFTCPNQACRALNISVLMLVLSSNMDCRECQQPVKFKFEGVQFSKIKDEVILECPICFKDLEIFEGETDNSGGYKKPYVFCSCGFQFDRNLPLDGFGEIGKDGWYAIEQHMKHEIAFLVRKFEKNGMR